MSNILNVATASDGTVMEYLRRMPHAIPADRVLVHNHVYPVTREPGERGSRIWLTPPNPAKLAVCDCGWAPELGQHFRIASRPQKEPTLVIYDPKKATDADRESIADRLKRAAISSPLKTDLESPGRA